MTTKHMLFRLLLPLCIASIFGISTKGSDVRADAQKKLISLNEQKKKLDEAFQKITASLNHVRKVYEGVDFYFEVQAVKNNIDELKSFANVLGPKTNAGKHVLRVASEFDDFIKGYTFHNNMGTLANFFKQEFERWNTWAKSSGPMVPSVISVEQNEFLKFFQEYSGKVNDLFEFVLLIARYNGKNPKEVIENRRNEAYKHLEAEKKQLPVAYKRIVAEKKPQSVLMNDFVKEFKISVDKEKKIDARRKAFLNKSSDVLLEKATQLEKFTEKFSTKRAFNGAINDDLIIIKTLQEDLSELTKLAEQLKPIKTIWSITGKDSPATIEMKERLRDQVAQLATRIISVLNLMIDTL